MVPVVLYYGPVGLAAEVFITYLRRLGYVVEIASSPETFAAVCQHWPCVLPVLAGAEPPEQQIRLAAEQLPQLRSRPCPLFVLADADFQSEWPWVEVFDQRASLKEVLYRINQLTQLRNACRACGLTARPVA